MPFLVSLQVEFDRTWILDIIHFRNVVCVEQQMTMNAHEACINYFWLATMGFDEIFRRFVHAVKADDNEFTILDVRIAFTKSVIVEVHGQAFITTFMVMPFWMI